MTNSTRFLAGFPHATPVVQWGDASLWKIAGRVFAIGGWSDLGAFAKRAQAEQRTAQTASISKQPAPLGDENESVFEVGEPVMTPASTEPVTAPATTNPAPSPRF